MSIPSEAVPIDQWPRLGPEPAQHMLHGWMSMVEICAQSSHALDLFEYLNRRFTGSWQSDGWVVAQLNASREDLGFAYSGGDAALSAQRLTRALMKPLLDRLAAPGTVLGYADPEALAPLLAAAGKDLPAAVRPEVQQSLLPSGEKATALTEYEWPSSVL